MTHGEQLLKEGQDLRERGETQAALAKLNEALEAFAAENDMARFAHTLPESRPAQKGDWLTALGKAQYLAGHKEQGSAHYNERFSFNRSAKTARSVRGLWRKRVVSYGASNWRIFWE
jgi:hypothetical protein